MICYLVLLVIKDQNNGTFGGQVAKVCNKAQKKQVYLYCKTDVNVILTVSSNFRRVHYPMLSNIGLFRLISCLK